MLLCGTYVCRERLEDKKIRALIYFQTGFTIYCLQLDYTISQYPNNRKKKVEIERWLSSVCKNKSCSTTLKLWIETLISIFISLVSLMEKECKPICFIKISVSTNLLIRTKFSKKKNLFPILAHCESQAFWHSPNVFYLFN